MRRLTVLARSLTPARSQALTHHAAPGIRVTRRGAMMSTRITCMQPLAAIPSLHRSAFSTIAKEAPASSLPACPQTFPPAEQAQIWSWTQSTTPLDSASMRNVLAFLVRACNAGMLRSDSLETLALFRIMAQYAGWQVPTSVPVSGAVTGQSNIITFPAAGGQTQIVAVYSDKAAIPDEVRLRNERPGTHTVGSMTIDGCALFTAVLGMSASHVPSPARASAISFNNGAATEKPTYAMMPTDVDAARIFLSSAVDSVLTTRALRNASQEEIATKLLPAWFGAAPAQAVPGAAYRPTRWWSAWSDQGLVSNDLGLTGQRQNLMLFAGPELAQCFLRVQPAAGGRVEPLTSAQALNLIRQHQLNAAFVRGLLPAEGKIDVVRVMREDFMKIAQ